MELLPAVRTLTRLARLLEHACTDLSLPQYRVLAMVASGDERATSLAERLTLAKPTVTAVVDGLVERGLLSRSAVVGDRRAIRLAVTPAGRKALAATDKELTARLKTVLGRTEHPARVLAALAEVQQSLDDARAERLATRP